MKHRELYFHNFISSFYTIIILIGSAFSICRTIFYYYLGVYSPFDMSIDILAQIITIVLGIRLYSYRNEVSSESYYRVISLFIFALIVNVMVLISLIYTDTGTGKEYFQIILHIVFFLIILIYYVSKRSCFFDPSEESQNLNGDTLPDTNINSIDYYENNEDNSEFNSTHSIRAFSEENTESNMFIDSDEKNSHKFSYQEEFQIIDLLKQYGELLEKGMITKEEYENKKRQLIWKSEHTDSKDPI